jgi:hypothetical protein
VTGLLTEITRRTNGAKKSVLGLWTDDLPGMLLWYRLYDGLRTSAEPLGRLANGMPTWTWASVEGKCSYNLAAGTVEWQTATEIDQATSPASLTIYTWKRKVLLDEDGDIVLDPDDPKTGQKGWGGDLDDVYSWFPDCGRPGDDQELYVVLIQRSKIAKKNTPTTWLGRCLLVTPSAMLPRGKGPHTFTRVGLVTIRFSNQRDDPFNSKDPDSREVIVLQ